MLILALACASNDISPFQRGVLPQAGDTAAIDTSGDSAGANDTALDDTGRDDTAGLGDSAADTGDIEPLPTEILACYLGPARDYSVCLPVVAYDPAVFGGDYEYPDGSSSGQAYATPMRFIDISAHSTELEIAPNFVLSEYLQEWKGRYGVMQDHVVDRLQDIRDQIGEPLTVNSGYRNPAYNVSIGGADLSRHMYGDAADIRSGSYSVEALGVVCEELGADYVGLYEDGHTHCDWRYAEADGAFYGEIHQRPIPTETAQVRAFGRVLTAPAYGFDEGEPLRRWTAYDADARVLISTTGREFEPPAGSVRVAVVVGGRVRSDYQLGR